MVEEAEGALMRRKMVEPGDKLSLWAEFRPIRPGAQISLRFTRLRDEIIRLSPVALPASGIVNPSRILSGGVISANSCDP